MRTLRRPSLHFPILLLILAFYAIIAGLTSLTEQPWSDEAWFASPAINLIEHGYMGNSVKEIEGSPWTRMDRRTYWQPPLYFLAQAGWYKLFGIGIFSMRFMSVFFGGVFLVSLYSFLATLTKNRTLALISVLLMSSDFIFINSASEGRMDVMSAALALAGFAAYMKIREKNLTWAIFICNAFVVASGLTHPNGIIALFGIILIGLYYDHDRLKLKHYMIALIPYLIGGIGWGIYILQDPGAFADQFGANMSGKFIGSNSLIGMFASEITRRYLYAYGFFESGMSGGKLKILILICYFAGVVGSVFVLRNPSRRNDRILLWLAILFFLSMTILAGNKMPRYLIWAIPFYISLLSVSAISCAGFSKKAKIAVVLVLSGLFILQTGVNVRRITKDKYRNIYIPAVEELKSLDKGSAIIMGPAELAFSFGFDSEVIDDPSLGYYSGKRPDIIVVDPRYSNWFDRFKEIQPETYKHIEALLENEFDKTYENVKFNIYVRKNRNFLREKDREAGIGD